LEMAWPRRGQAFHGRARCDSRARAAGRHAAGVHHARRRECLGVLSLQRILFSRRAVRSARVSPGDPHLGALPEAQREERFATLEEVVAGSWVYGNFSTWIGSADKNRAWNLLCTAKQGYDLVMASGRLIEPEAAAAQTLLGICEGSDWFWWFGDYNPQDAVATFDR